MSQSHSAPTARYIHESETHNEAFARLQFLVQQRRRLGLLFGERGCGKSLLLDQFAAQLRRGGDCVVRVGLIGLDEWQFVWELSAQMGHCPADDVPLHRLWRRVADGLIENRYQQLSTVVLFDDASQASDEVQIAIERLLQCGSTSGAPLTVVLSAESGSVAAGQLSPRLLELAELRIDLDRWEPEDTADYLNGRSLQAAGNIPFATDAKARLHELCDGLPRQVSQLTDLALLAGEGGQLDEIDAETVEGVYQELAVSPGF